MQNLLCSRDLTLATKIQIKRCYEFPVLLYGIKAWTLTKESEKKIKAFEKCICRQLLEI